MFDWFEIFKMIYLCSALVVALTFAWQYDSLTEHLTPPNRYNVADLIALFIVFLIIGGVPIVNSFVAYGILVYVLTGKKPTNKKRS